MIPRCTVEAVEYHAISSGLLARDKGQGQGQGQVKRYPSFVHWLVHTVGVAVAGSTDTTPTAGGNASDGVHSNSSSSSSSSSFGSPLSPPQLCGDARGAVDSEKTRLLRSLAAAGGVWGKQVQTPPLPYTHIYTLLHTHIYTPSLTHTHIYPLTHSYIPSLTPSPPPSPPPSSRPPQVAEVLTDIARRAPLTVASLRAASLTDEMNEKNGATGASATVTQSTQSIGAAGGGGATAVAVAGSAAVAGVTANTSNQTNHPTPSPTPTPDAIHELFGLVAFCGGTLEGTTYPPIPHPHPPHTPLPTPTHPPHTHLPTPYHPPPLRNISASTDQLTYLTPSLTTQS